MKDSLGRHFAVRLGHSAPANGPEHNPFLAAAATATASAGLVPRLLQIAAPPASVSEFAVRDDRAEQGQHHGDRDAQHGQVGLDRRPHDGLDGALEDLVAPEATQLERALDAGGAGAVILLVKRFPCLFPFDCMRLRFSWRREPTEFRGSWCRQPGISRRGASVAAG